MTWRAERAVREGWKTSSFLCLALWPEKKAKNAIEVESWSRREEGGDVSRTNRALID